MARIAGPYIVETSESDGRPFYFNCVAISEADALRQFKRLHKHWRRPIKINGPADIVEPEPKKRKATRRRKG